jgi:adenine-specific DNA-methyltransferase
MTEYSKKSRELTKLITSDVKKKNGIYFTPPSIVKKHMTILKPHLKKIKTILEPSCGSGEYLNVLDDGLNEITAIELDATIYGSIKDNEYKNTTLINTDFLTWVTNKTFDLIVGNPPYFVLKKDDMPNECDGFYDGRPNIFVAFIVKSLSLLSDGGIMGFVLPVSFTNCLYYDKLRKHITDNYKIIDITNCTDDKYLDTSQETMLFTVKKHKVTKNDDYVYNHLDYTIFNTKERNKALRELYNNSTTLSSLGMNVNVGTVVWNQKKGELTTDNKQTRLIYSSDIKDNKLVLTKYNNEAKKNYIKQDGSKELTMVINRGYGVGKYAFSYSLIDVDYDYLVENHLICIRPGSEKSTDELRVIYERVTRSFEDERTKQFIALYFGNSAINTTEMKYILPIY